jgi:tetratricopeptide (TPR) repeat protein
VAYRKSLDDLAPDPWHIEGPRGIKHWIDQYALNYTESKTTMEEATKWPTQEDEMLQIQEQDIYWGPIVTSLRDRCQSHLDQIAEQDYNNGLAALKKNEFTGAIDLFTKALTLKPNFDKALANRAIANTRLKQHSAAISDINSAIKINAQNPEFYFNKSLIFYDLIQKDSEMVALDNCLRINPSHAEACYYKGIYLYDLRKP